MMMSGSANWEGGKKLVDMHNQDIRSAEGSDTSINKAAAVVACPLNLLNNLHWPLLLRSLSVAQFAYLLGMTRDGSDGE